MRRPLAVTLLTVLSTAALVVASVPASAATWTRTGRTTVATLFANQGVFTVAGEVRYRGVLSIPLSVAVEGWVHIGDADAHEGTVVDAYQGSADATTKMFRVTTPTGAAYEYVHHLVPGELYNNSFATISPDGQWLVAGEWETVTHLQVYPAPYLNAATPRAGGRLDLAGSITLDRPVTNVQSCDFVTATSLVCASDDASAGQPLLQVDLARAPDGEDVAGRVSTIAPLPKESPCTGSYEAEGVDFDPASGTLRAAIVQPSICILATYVYSYRVAEQT